MESGFASLRRPSLHPSQHTYGDRFIPNRGAMNMDIAEALLFVTRKEESRDEISPSRVAYRKLLADTLLKGRTRIFSFCNQPSTPIQSLPEPPLPPQVQPAKQRRHIPQSSEKTLDASDIVGDDRFNLLDWGSKNLLSIALDDTVYLWNATNGMACKFKTVTEDYAPVTSVSWAADGRHIAVGCNNSTLDLYDATTNRLLRILTELNQGPICSLAWNNHILTTGGANGTIINNDVRIRSHAVSVYRGHDDAVCGLKWSSSGEQLASGGNDKLLHIWDISKSTHLHRFNNHTGAIRAVAWCPFKDNLLASGGGETDHCIKFWNLGSGTCMKSVDTGSQVCSLLWSKNERELLSSHGRRTNLLTLWEYPSMVKIAELAGHTSPVLYTAQSPDGCKVASASEDEMLKIWRISEISKRKNKPKTPHVLFGPSNMHIR